MYCFNNFVLKSIWNFHWCKSIVVVTGFSPQKGKLLNKATSCGFLYFLTLDNIFVKILDFLVFYLKELLFRMKIWSPKSSKSWKRDLQEDSNLGLENVPMKKLNIVPGSENVQATKIPTKKAKPTCGADWKKLPNNTVTIEGLLHSPIFCVAHVFSGILICSLKIFHKLSCQEVFRR